MQRSYSTYIKDRAEFDAIRLNGRTTSITLIEVTDLGHRYEVTEFAPYNDDPIHYREVK